MTMLKDLKLKDITYQNKLLIIVISSSMEKTFMINQLILIQNHDRIRWRLYYTTGSLLDYDYIKNHYRLIAVDLSRQKELDTDPKDN